MYVEGFEAEGAEALALAIRTARQKRSLRDSPCHVLAVSYAITQDADGYNWHCAIVTFSR